MKITRYKVPRKRYLGGMRTHLCLPGIRPHAVAICGRKEPEKRSMLWREVDCRHCIRAAALLRTAYLNIKGKKRR